MFRFDAHLFNVFADAATAAVAAATTGAVLVRSLHTMYSLSINYFTMTLASRVKYSGSSPT